MSPLPLVALVVTGGTIDTIGRDRMDLADYADNGRWLTPAELVASVPESGDFCRVEIVDVGRPGARGMSMADWLGLHDAVTRAVADGAAGVVITSGTNFIEETAYFLSLTLNLACPVVMTAAMRPPSAIGSDSPLNLLRALQVAASPLMAGMGVTVVLDETIHAARDVTKGHSHALDAFESRTYGPLGVIDANGRILLHRRPMRRQTADSEFHLAPGTSALPRVEITISSYGADGALVDAAVAAGAAGIVNAGYGAGRAGPEIEAALDRAVAAGVVVVQATRVGRGQVIHAPGLSRRGVVAAGDLLPWKARILLMLALTRTREHRTIQAAFDSY